MNARLQYRFEQLEEARRSLHKELSGVSAMAFQHRNGDKWSIGQITAHVVHAERLSIKYIKKKKLGIQDLRNTGIWESIKVILLRISQRMPFRFKAPAVVVLSTPYYSDPATLQAEWDIVRNELKELLEEFDDHEIKKRVYRHVVVGLLNIEQTITFFHEHFLHHLPQIKRQL